MCENGFHAKACVSIRYCIICLRHAVYPLLEQSVQESIVQVIARSQILMDIVRLTVEEMSLLHVRAVREILFILHHFLGGSAAAFKGRIFLTAASHIDEIILTLFVNGSAKLIQHNTAAVHTHERAGKGKEIAAYIQHLIEQEPGIAAATGKAAECPVITGGLKTCFIRRFGIGAIFSFDHRHQFFTQFPHENIHIAELFPLIVVVAGSNQYKRTNHSCGDHMVKGIDGCLVAQQSGRITAVAMKEVDDRVTVCSVFVVAIGQVNIDVIGIRLIIKVVLIFDFYNCAVLLIRRFIKFPVIEQIMGGNTRYSGSVQNGGRLIGDIFRVSRSHIAQNNQDQYRCQQLFHLFSLLRL